MSETEITGAAPVARWMRGATGTISLGRAHVKGEAMVELTLRDATGAGQPCLLDLASARLLADRMVEIVAAASLTIPDGECGDD